MNAGRFVLTDLLTFFMPKFTTCPLCGEMDGKVFPVNKMQSGTTAPPFHPWCRGTTAPYYEDMVGVGQRFARDIETGKGYYLPSDTTYEQWKAMQDAKYGEGSVDKARKMAYNEKADKEQFERYKKLLGNKAPNDFTTFQKIKYSDDYSKLKIQYADARIQNRIKNGKISTIVIDGKQGKHILGHNNFIKGRSYLKEGIDVQTLVDKYAGNGEIKRDKSGKWAHKEKIITDDVIGYVVSLVDGSEEPTKAFIIHYSKNGVHIVPGKE